MAGEARAEDRSVPEALRRGLTFWRRSIQARVAVSTLLVSAIVVSAVGWFLLRQIEQGLVDHRVAAVLTEVANEGRQASTALDSASPTDTDAEAQARDLVNSIVESGQARGFSVLMAGPGRGDTSLEDRGDRGTSGLVASSVPTSLVQHFDDSAKTA